jgi:hypothetical protein
MGPMVLAATVVVASSLANLTVEFGLNTLQNWSDVFYQDAFWSARHIASPELDQLSREEAEIAKLMAKQDFDVGPVTKTELDSVPSMPRR